MPIGDDYAIMKQMITRVVVKNYRGLRNLVFLPRSGMNIVVGDNQAGKSTLLEAINLGLTGRVTGRRAAEDLSPYWFNADAVEEFFRQVEAGAAPEPPSILIEIYLAKDDQPQQTRGKVNSLNEDCPGLRFIVELDDDYRVEFDQYLKSQHPPLLPVEYFRTSWRDFRDMELGRRPDDLGVAWIDGRTVRSTATVDHHTRQLLADFVEKREAATISVAYRQARHDLTLTVLKELNRKIEQQTSGVLPSVAVGLEMDQSASSTWEATVVPHVGRIPFAMAGQGQQVMIKTALALSSSADRTGFVLVEEPENHLSHTSLTTVVSAIANLAKDRQSFVVTHSSFVLNRLGLDGLHVMHDGSVRPFADMTQETVDYYRLQPGYDTLRMVLATKLVIVEGPSDEMVFNRAYQDLYGGMPRDAGIDVVAQGTRGKRALELCTLLDRKAAVLRDVDSRTPDYWRTAASRYLLHGRREMFVGEAADGHTLEPQLIKANERQPDLLRSVTACPEEDDLLQYMTDNKTDVAWQIATSAKSITFPDYITAAAKFIHDL